VNYEYFERDGAYFRAMANTGLACVDEVWTADGWTPYNGDRGKPVAFGNKVTSVEVFAHIRWLAEREVEGKAAAAEPPKVEPVQAVPRAKEGREHPNLISLTKRREGRAFQILAGPPKSKR
jgi:hypothetical protein